MVDTLRTPFVEAMDDLVLKPRGDDPFDLRPTVAARAPGDGRDRTSRGWHGSSGGFHVFPEHAAAGLWSTPTDIANLLLVIGRAWRGESANPDPGEGQGMVVMTNSDNGSILAEALIRRAAELYGWPALPALAD